MRKKLICLLVAGSLPGFAMADATSDQIKALQAQLNALQKEVKQLRSEVATKPKAAQRPSTAAPAPAVVAAPVDISSPDYGKAQATLTNDQVDGDEAADRQSAVEGRFAGRRGEYRADRRFVGDGLYRSDLLV